MQQKNYFTDSFACKTNKHLLIGDLSGGISAFSSPPIFSEKFCTLFSVQVYQTRISYILI
ncbi:hypothetical protein CCS41_10375 [Candidatus Fukatsuia symbiotica]|uniref:Uncharacterized protein n=1 Tax=Candidatus Fukatsuia symbiotica TaxID=1878942 RepID=A0A2U8I9R7_9GAMM|nr:hypothetical protein CCS41_10375 [Candidatus Fukatsuia symbiotica]